MGWDANFAEMFSQRIAGKNVSMRNCCCYFVAGCFTTAKSVLIVNSTHLIGDCESAFIVFDIFRFAGGDGLQLHHHGSLKSSVDL